MALTNAGPITVRLPAGQHSLTWADILAAAEEQGVAFVDCVELNLEHDAEASRLDEHDLRRCCGEHYSDPHAAGCTQADLEAL